MSKQNQPLGKYAISSRTDDERYKIEKEQLVKKPIRIRNDCPKEMHVVVYSGMCNRLFLIISAMRLIKKSDHKLTVFWSERTGRYGLPYYGTLYSDWDDYFERLPDIQTYGIQGSIKFQDNYIALDQERTQIDNLPIANGKPYAPSDMAVFLFGPKMVNLSQNKIIVQKLTKPFGSIDDVTYMKKYLNYIDKIGSHQKDLYLQELSAEIKKFKPLSWIQEIINKEFEKFSSFDQVWGIHLRGTDLAPQTTKDRKAALMAIFQQRKVSNNNIGIFLASDEPTPNWIKEALNDNLITYNNDVKLENSVEGTQHSLVDLWLLAKCKVIYGTSGSSFSMLSWLLSDATYIIHS